MNTVGEKTTDRPVKRRKHHFVSFNRDAEVERARQELPVCMHEQEIIEAVHSSDVTVIISSTGSGKTTQVPQFLLENGFGSDISDFREIIAVTQPRRIAAISSARRVAYETSTEVGDMIGYHVRHNSKLGPSTKVKFCTDGILLNEIEHDILLSKYSAVIVDEAHERTLNTDMILSFLSKTISLRRQQSSVLSPLKVIVMSATVDVSTLFGENKLLSNNVRTVEISSRQHPVTIHFSKETPNDYMEAAFHKIVKIHRRLPPGGILVFLSGKDEVDQLCEKLSAEFAITSMYSRAVILPLYSVLSDVKQQLVFREHPSGCRKIIVATNVAETSITVPGISYIVDSGVHKERSFLIGAIGTSSLDVQWISKSSAEQRAGRAGRTGPGHCYRLYSSAVFNNHFPAFRSPEMSRVPMESVVLRLRSMGISQVNKFPFLSKPSAESLCAADDLLVCLGALNRCKNDNDNIHNRLSLTPLGMKLSNLPLSPRLGRLVMAAMGTTDLARCACRLVAVIAVGNIWEGNATFSRRKSKFVVSSSDPLTDLRALLEVELRGGKFQADLAAYQARVRNCASVVGLNFRAVAEVLSIVRQLEELLFSSDKTHKFETPILTERVEKLLAYACFHAFPDHLARKLSLREAEEIGIQSARRKKAFMLPDSRIAFPHVHSGIKPLVLKSEFVCFVELEQRNPVQTGNISRTAIECAELESTLLLRGVFSVETSWIREIALPLCNVEDLKAPAEIRYDLHRECITQSCVCRYGQWFIGHVHRPAEELLASSIGKNNIEAYLNVFARAILAGHVDERWHDKGVVVPKQVAVQRLSEVLGANGSCLSRHSLHDAMIRRGDFVTNAINSWGCFR